jgi:hypothetical protein
MAGIGLFVWSLIRGQGEPALTLVPWPFGVRPLSGHIKPKNVGFQLGDPDLVQAWDICNIFK